MTPISRRSVFAAGVAGAATLGLAACGGSDSTDTSDASSTSEGAASGELTTLRVGASPVPHAQVLQFVQDNLAADAGLDLVIEEFTDYQIPNRVLQDGEIDANYFQTENFLKQQISEFGYDIVAFEGIHVEPMGIYSEQVTSLEDIPDGAEISVPNDPTNRGRALDLLAANGLITLTEGLEPTLGTLDDVVENPKNLVISEVDGPILARSLADFSAGVINGNYALEAGFSPASDALVLEAGEGNPNANFLATTADRQDDEAIVTLNELLHSDEVRQFIEETFTDGSVIPAF